MAKKEDVVVGVNIYYTAQDLDLAIAEAKCCIAKKQAAQVKRETMLMGRCSVTDAEIEFLQSALIFLEHEVHEGEFNQITNSEALQLIGRIETICSCGDYEALQEPSKCELPPVCIGGVIQLGETGQENIPQQTIYPDFNCTYVFSITDPDEGSLAYYITKNGSNWELIDSNEDVIDTNATITENWTFAVGDNNYALNITSGSCVPVVCQNICVFGNYVPDAGGETIILPPNSYTPYFLNGQCAYDIVLPTDTGGTITITLTKIGSLWTILYNNTAYDTSSTLNGAYSFFIDTPIRITYNLTINLGNCT